MNVTPGTITHWRTAGYLTPMPFSPPRRPFYDWDNVVAAEYRAWQAAITASGTDHQIRRRAADVLGAALERERDDLTATEFIRRRAA